VHTKTSLAPKAKKGSTNHLRDIETGSVDFFTLRGSILIGIGSMHVANSAIVEEVLTHEAKRIDRIG
jgi:hypothetical protein